MIEWGENDLPLTDLLVAVLPRTRDEALPIARLAKRCHAPKRATEEALQELALSGRYSLVAWERGVYLSSDPAEVEAYIESLRRRLVSQYQRIRALRPVARRMRNYRQMELFG